jgi:hypothetical protein
MMVTREENQFFKIIEEKHILLLYWWRRGKFLEKYQSGLAKCMLPYL